MPVAASGRLRRSPSRAVGDVEQTVLYRSWQFPPFGRLSLPFLLIERDSKEKNRFLFDTVLHATGVHHSLENALDEGGGGNDQSVNSAFSLLTRITFLYAIRSSPSNIAAGIRCGRPRSCRRQGWIQTHSLLATEISPRDARPAKIRYWTQARPKAAIAASCRCGACPSAIALLRTTMRERCRRCRHFLFGIECRRHWPAPNNGRLVHIASQAS